MTIPMVRFIPTFALILFALQLTTSDAHASRLLRKPLTPVLLAPGLLIPVAAYETDSIREIFRTNGYDLRVAQSPPSGAVEYRAEQLHREIKRLIPTGAFHIVAVSVGGMDARRAIQKYELGSRVISLTTISTPHRGTPVAESMLPDSPAYALFKDVQDALKDLTTSATDRFNRMVKNDPRVLYYSIGFMIPEPVFLATAEPPTLFLHGLIKTLTGEDNDSLVGIGSAHWGTYLGTMEGDHLSISVAHPYQFHMIYPATYQKVLQNLKEVDRAVN